MAARIHKQKQEQTRRTEETVTEGPAPQDEKSKAQEAQGEKLKSEIDDLLDEIDGVLETNAEEFVKGYVQKGGE